MSFSKTVSNKTRNKKHQKHEYMEDLFILVEAFSDWDKREEPSLQFNLVYLNMKPIAESVTVGGRKWLEKIHISLHIWVTNLDV